MEMSFEEAEVRKVWPDAICVLAFHSGYRVQSELNDEWKNLSSFFATPAEAWYDAYSKFLQPTAVLGVESATALERSKPFLELVMLAAKIEECDKRSEQQDDWNLRHYKTLSRPSAVIAMWDLVGNLFREINTERTMHNAWRKRAEEAETKLAALPALTPEPPTDSPARFTMLAVRGAYAVELCGKWGIINRNQTRNAEMSDLHDTADEAWIDAAERLGYSELKFKSVLPVTPEGTRERPD